MPTIEGSDITISSIAPELLPPLDPLVGPADNIVPGMLTAAAAASERALTNALTQITNMGNSMAGIDLPTITTPALHALEPDLHTPSTQPAEPSGLASPSFPIAPAEPIFEDIAALSLDSPPTFEVTTPLISDVPFPDPFSALVPSKPELGEVTMPVEPGFALPAVPTLVSLNLPDVPTITLPLFTDTAPTGPASPDASFAWAEIDYNTNLLTAMNTRLLDFVNGASTGLEPAVEAAIWSRARDRETTITLRAIESLPQAFASRGHSMPPGAMLTAIQEALQESMTRDSGLSRDVMVKQAELEQSNFHFAFTSAMQLEGSLLAHFNQVQARALDAGKFAVGIVIQVFNARVSLYQADVQAFGMKAEVFKTRLSAALAQLEVYKAQLEGEKAKGELNRTAAAIYEAQVNGVRALAEFFRVRVEAAKSRIEADRNKVESFRAEVQAYEAESRAKASEYQGYGERVKAELTKTEIFGQQVSAYKGRVDGYKVLADVRLAEKNFDVKRLLDAPLELFKGRSTAFQTLVQAEAERLRALSSAFEARVRAYSAFETAYAQRDQASAEIFRGRVQLATGTADIAIKNAEINLRAYTSVKEIIAGTVRAAGTISAQVASATWAARNVSASLSSSVGTSYSSSHSNSTGRSSSDGASASVGVSFDETKSVPTTSNVHTYKEK